MAFYINSTENEHRYNELRSKYAGKIEMRNNLIQVKRARLEFEEQALQDIERAINELNSTGAISYEVAKKREKMWSARTRAIGNVRRANIELNAAIVGEDAMKEFKNAINKNS